MTGGHGLTTSGGLSGTESYFSPELVSPKDDNVEAPEKTTASDMWAWGSLVVEVCVGVLFSQPDIRSCSSLSLSLCLIDQVVEEKVPYADLKGGQVYIAIVSGILPTPEDSLSRCVDLWQILKKCWVKDPAGRVDSQTCLGDLSALVGLPLQLPRLGHIRKG